MEQYRIYIVQNSVEKYRIVKNCLEYILYRIVQNSIEQYKIYKVQNSDSDTGKYLDSQTLNKAKHGKYLYSQTSNRA